MAAPYSSSSSSCSISSCFLLNKNKEGKEYGTFKSTCWDNEGLSNACKILIDENDNSNVATKNNCKDVLNGNSLFRYTKLFSLFVLWYILNIFYNIENKNALIMINLPYTVSCIQLMVGWFFFSFAWLFKIREIPHVYSTKLFFKSIFPQGIFHLLVHIGAVISIGAGAVSFTHIVKSGEPVVTAILSSVILHEVFSIYTYLSLIPIVFGVALASLKELSFSYTAFICAMVSNIGSSCRCICAKKVMSNKSSVGKNLTSSNMFALLTIVATLLCIPLVIILEGKDILKTFNQFSENSQIYPFTKYEILTKIILSGIYYYLYNEIAFNILEEVNQVTHAVANTLKRVFVIIASIIVFQTPVNCLGVIGSTVAVLGTFFYSLSKLKYG